MSRAPCNQRGGGSAKVDRTGPRPETVPLSSPVFLPASLFSQTPLSFIHLFLPSFLFFGSFLYFSLAPHCQVPPPPFAGSGTSPGLRGARTGGSKVESGCGWGAGYRDLPPGNPLAMPAASTCRGAGRGGAGRGRGGAVPGVGGGSPSGRGAAAAAVRPAGVGRGEVGRPLKTSEIRDQSPASETWGSGLEQIFLRSWGAHAGLPHGRHSGPRSSGSLRGLLPSRFPALRTALPGGCCLQSGCDGRPEKGGRAREPLRLLCGSASAVTAPTPELVSHRARPESPYPSHRLPTPASSPSLPTPLRLGCSQLILYPDLELCLISVGFGGIPLALALGMSWRAGFLSWQRLSSFALHASCILASIPSSEG